VSAEHSTRSKWHTHLDKSCNHYLPHLPPAIIIIIIITITAAAAAAAAARGRRRQRKY